MLAYHELVNLYKAHSVDRSLSALLDAAVEHLELPETHEGYAADLQSVCLEWEHVDVVIPLHHFDDGRCGYWARAILGHKPDAFFIPSGGHLPHKAKRGPEHLPQFSEAEETVACLLQDNYHYKYNFPNLPDIGDYPPVKPWDILSPDEVSVDTCGNAYQVADRLKILQGIRCGRALNV